MQKVAGGVTAQFVFDRFGHLLEEADSSGTVQKEYIWLNDLPVAVVDDTGASPVLYFIHTDQIGTPQKITDGTASIVWDGALDPFGNPASVTGSLTNNLRFPGQYLDAETALNQNWNRDYDPTIGRYIQSDPVGLKGGLNNYAYVLGNPEAFGDPQGKFLVGLAGLGIGAAIGGGTNLVAQLIQNDWNWSCVNWQNVGWSALSGGAAGLLLTTPFGSTILGTAGIPKCY